jgi:hypothetical protein
MTRFQWIVLGLTAFVVVLVVTITAVFIGSGYLRRGDMPIELATPDQISPTATLISGVGKISGLVWHDICASGGLEQVELSSPPVGCILTGGGGYLANGQRESGEFGIAGITVLLGQGACPASGLAATTTSADGSFSFPLLARDNYCVSIDPSLGSNAGILLPGSWSLMPEDTQAMRNVSLGEGESEIIVEFGWDYAYLPLPPTATATATSSPTPTFTPTPTSTPEPQIPCDMVGFVKDIAVPDGTIFGPDEDFRKTWRLKNIGTCTWSKEYALVFVSGNRMTGDNVTYLQAAVKPGATIDISIELTAPLQVGTHTGYWALRNAAGVIFGMGPQADDAFWVNVRVVKPIKLTIKHDFAENYCAATWVSAAGLIDCPTVEYDINGLIQRQDAPIMEGGRVENEQGLWVIPEGVDGGYLTGTFPPYKVESGDRFKTVVSCLEGYEACAVEFRLEYRIGEGEVKTLGKWYETYEGNYTKVNIDLTPLAGKEVQFILTIRALDVFDEDSGLWLRPSIWR